MRKLALAVALASMNAIAREARGQEADALFAEVLGANRYALGLADGVLTGPGAEFLVSAAAGTQFFLLGEDHNVAEIPKLTTALFQKLHDRYGFDYLADEQDVWMCSEISRPPYLGRDEEIRGLRAKYPNAFTFEGDEEIELLAAACRISTGKADRVWGLDQIFGALHVLERLEAIAADEGLRKRVHALVEYARPYESVRFVPGHRLMSEIVEIPEDLASISRWYRARPKDSAQGSFLARQVELSLRVYANWRHAAVEKQPTGYECNREREENMKEIFLARCREAERRDGRHPKVVFKFGHWHLYRGQGPGSVFTLGNFASEFARSDGSSSFAAAIFLDDGPGSKRDWSSWAPWAKPFIAAELSPGWTVLDLRPLRPLAHARRLGAMPPELWRLLFGFDALIILKGAHPATLPRSVDGDLTPIGYPASNSRAARRPLDRAPETVPLSSASVASPAK